MTKKLLLIEDDMLISDLYKLTFVDSHIPTDVASTGADGLRKAQEFPYSLILLDMMLPDMDGIEILKQLKANDKTKDIPVIFMSNLGQDSIIKEGLRLGAIAYFVKVNYTPDQVVAEVNNILANPSAGKSQ